MHLAKIIIGQICRPSNPLSTRSIAECRFFSVYHMAKKENQGLIFFCSKSMLLSGRTKIFLTSLSSLRYLIRPSPEKFFNDRFYVFLSKQNVNLIPSTKNNNKKPAVPFNLWYMFNTNFCLLMETFLWKLSFGTIIRQQVPPKPTFVNQLRVVLTKVMTQSQ